MPVTKARSAKGLYAAPVPESAAKPNGIISEYMCTLDSTKMHKGRKSDSPGCSLLIFSVIFSFGDKVHQLL